MTDRREYNRKYRSKHRTRIAEQKRRGMEIRRAAGRFVIGQVRRKTVCVKCGRQPVDFHCDAHKTQPSARISNLVEKGATISRIMRELKRCTPLCRRCHIALHRRMARAEANQYQRAVTVKE